MEDQNCFQERERVLYYVHIYVGMDRFFFGGGGWVKILISIVLGGFR